ncbi:MAG: spore coat protein CotJB [Eubacteriales bacterium]
MLDETVRRGCNGQLLGGSDTDRNTARREDNDRPRYADRNRNDMENRYGQVRRDGDDRRGRDNGNMRQDRDSRYGNSREGEHSENRRCGCNSGRDNDRNRGPVYGFPNGVGRMGPTGCVGPVPRFGSCCLNGYGMPRTGLGSCCAGRSGNSYDDNDRSARERSCGCGRDNDNDRSARERSCGCGRDNDNDRSARERSCGCGRDNDNDRSARERSCGCGRDNDNDRSARERSCGCGRDNDNDHSARERSCGCGRDKDNDRSARERSCGCGREREGCNGESLLDTLQALDFALFEVTLYLDAYCDDCQALELYHRLLEQRRVAAEKYEAEIGPLTFRGNRSCTQWDWVNEPYPWDIRANK